MENYDVIIVGGGPAGLTTGLYTSRAGLKSLSIERGSMGGQMTSTGMVENYPGFPDGISGSELGSLMHRQAERYGLKTITGEVTNIEKRQPFVVNTTEGSFSTTALVIASGSEHRKLKITGEDRLAGRGISYCATCDGFFFRNREVAVVGGGDTAVTDALELAQHASKVTLIHRRDQLRAGQVLQQRVLSHPKIDFIWNTEIREALGDKTLSELSLHNVINGRRSVLKVDGLFIAVGVTPNSRDFLDGLALDASGYIIVDQIMATSVPGVFAAGDVRIGSPRQIAAAVGDGVTAATSVFKYVLERMSPIINNNGSIINIPVA